MIKSLMIRVCHLMKRFIAALFICTFFAAAPAFGAGDTPIYTITTTTPGGEELRADEERILAGSSCNNLVVVDDFHSFGEDYVSVVAKTKGLTSDIITEIAGAGRGCFQVDILYNNKTVSTGPIQLFWDKSKNEYIAASPGAGVMHFN